MYRREARRSNERGCLFVLPTAAELKILGNEKLGRKFAPFLFLWVSSSEKSYKCIKSPKIGQKSKIHTGVRDRTRIKNSRRGCRGASARIKNSHAGMGVYACAWVKIHTGACAYVCTRARCCASLCGCAYYEARVTRCACSYLYARERWADAKKSKNFLEKSCTIKNFAVSLHQQNTKTQHNEKVRLQKRNLRGHSQLHCRERHQPRQLRRPG